MDFIFGWAPYTIIQISCQLCSNVDIKDSWAHQILQKAHKNFKWPIKIWKFEWDMGHWPILRAHHHFELGLTLCQLEKSLIRDCFFCLLDAAIYHFSLFSQTSPYFYWREFFSLNLRASLVPAYYRDKFSFCKKAYRIVFH